VRITLRPLAPSLNAAVHAWFDHGALVDPPRLPVMHPHNASWYTSATYELLTANFIHVRASEWKDRVHTVDREHLRVQDRQRNVVEIAQSDIATLAKVLGRSVRGIRPAFVVSKLTGEKMLDIKLPGDGHVLFHPVSDQQFSQRSFKPSTRPGEDSLMSSPRIAIHRSLDPQEHFRSPYVERAIRYLWAFGASPVVMRATTSSALFHVKNDSETQARVHDAVHALTGHARDGERVSYGTAELAFAELDQDRDLHECTFLNPLVSRISVV
jgi:hypothetical protein